MTLSGKIALFGNVPGVLLLSHETFCDLIMGLWVALYSISVYLVVRRRSSTTLPMPRTFSSSNLRPTI